MAETCSQTVRRVSGERLVYLIVSLPVRTFVAGSSEAWIRYSAHWVQ